MTNQTAIRATKGGEHGLNGKFYEGGQFLPNSPQTIKGEATQAKKSQQPAPRKQEIANYKWGVSSQVAIWGAVGVGAYTKFTQTGYSKETGAQGTLEVIENTPFWQETPEAKQAEIKELVNRWNNGDRWI